jgi:hypothetical protein
MGAKIAIYDLSGLGTGVTSMSSSIDTANQPILYLPSRNKIKNCPYCLGAIDPAWSPSDPEKYPQGLLINQGDYIYIDGRWDVFENYATMYLWIFYDEGEMGYFADYRITVSKRVKFYRLLVLVPFSEICIEVRNCSQYRSNRCRNTVCLLQARWRRNKIT